MIKLIKTERSAVSKNRAECSFFFAASAAKFWKHDISSASERAFPGSQQWPNTRITLIVRTRQSVWHDAETTPVVKKQVDSCVLKPPLIWGSSATKIPENLKKPGNAFSGANNVTFSKFRGWRRNNARFFETVLCAVFINKLIIN